LDREARQERYDWPEIFFVLLFGKKFYYSHSGSPGFFNFQAASQRQKAKNVIFWATPWMRVLIPLELTAPEYKLGQASVPALHASASRDKDGKLHLSIVNLDPNRAAQISTKIVGASAKSITCRVLTAPAMNTVNTFDKPDGVKPERFTGIEVQGDQITLSLPSKSVVVLEIQ